MRTTYNKDVIVIVGGMSSGHRIAPLFCGLGYTCVHVCTKEIMEHPVLGPTFKTHDYAENHVLESEDDVGTFLSRIHGRDVKAVIAGNELCVLLADKLSETLDTPRNIGALSWARRSKYLMHDTLKRNGLKSARQLLTDNVTQIYQFHDEIGAKIVVKPEASANTDGVFYCNDRAEIRKAADCLLGVRNFTFIVNKNVLVQEYLAGKQYLVNTMSSNGHHHVCDVWGEVRYDDEAPSNDSHADLVRPEDSPHHALAQYATRALDALGIRYGAAHFEMRMTDEGPCLIEVAARMPGNVDFAVLHRIHSLTQLSLLPDAMLDPESFRTRVNASRPSKTSARKVYLASAVEGDVLRNPDLDLLLGIGCVNSLCFRLTKGERLYKTNRALGRSRPGYLYMVSNDAKTIVSDYEIVRRNEQRLYETMLLASDEAAR